MGVYSLFVAVAGFAVAVLASRWVVSHASRLAYGTTIPPYLIGVTIVALGTDGPEIATSIMAALAGHGDVLVGDSVGSVFTQITLVLALLPLGGGKFPVGSPRSAVVAMLGALGLIVSVLLTSDGFFSRADGILLVIAWVAGAVISWHVVGPQSEPLMVVPERSKLAHTMLMFGSIGLVLAGAGAAVQGITELARTLGTPEYVISFFGASLGTSLPEIVVSITALRLGQRDLAMGDIMGACLMDATLSMGSGPLVAPTPVTAELAARGALLAVGALLVVSLLLWTRGQHDRWSAAVLLLLYAAAYYLLPV